MKNNIHVDAADIAFGAFMGLTLGCALLLLIALMASIHPVLAVYAVGCMVVGAWVMNTGIVRL